MPQLFKPKNSKAFERTISKLSSETDIEQYRIFMHYLIRQNLKSDFYITVADTPCSKKFLTKCIFHANNYMDILIKASGSIRVDNSYTVGLSPKKFRVNYFGKLDYDVYDYEFQYVKNKKKFKKLFPLSIEGKANNIPKDINCIKQLEFIGKLSCDTSRIKEAVKLTARRKLETGKKLIEQHRLNKKLTQKDEIRNEIRLKKLKQDVYSYKMSLEESCINFDVKKESYISDDFAGRHYNFFTQKPKEIRELFTLNGKVLESLDIKSSQIYFLTQLPQINLAKYKVDKTNVKVHKAKIKIDDDFKNIVLNGDIYSYLAEKLGLVTKDASDGQKERARKEAKKKLLSFMYGDKRLKKLDRILKYDFPLTYNTIKYLGGIETGDERFNYTFVIHESVEVVKKVYFNYILQSVEKDVFLNSFGDLKDYYTVHDSVYFEQERKEEFKSQILSYFKSLGLDEPTLH